MSDLRDHWGTTHFLLKKNYKTLGLTVEQRGKELALYKTVLALDRQRRGDAISPIGVRWKVRTRPTYSKSRWEAFSCALGICQECDIVPTPDQQPKSKTLLGMSKGLAWGSCWRCLSAIFTHQLYSIIKENYMPYSHICITNLAP